MAQVGEDTGIPTVEPSSSGINVRATPEDFGAGIGSGLQKLGQGLDKATDFYGQVAADDATNNWHKKVENILYGDPNDPSSPGYFSLHGSDAMSARPQVVQDLQAAADEQRQTLFTPQSKFQFDQDTRRSRFLIDQQIGSHYDQQAQVWGLKTNGDKLTMAGDSVARNPTDPVTLGLALTQAREAAVRIEQLQNGRDADPSAAITKADQTIRLKQLDALRVTNPQSALDLLTKDPGGEVLRSLPNYASLVHTVQEDAVNASSAKATDASIADWKNRAANAVHLPQSQTPLAAGTQPLVDKIDPAYRGVVGNILAGESVHDEHSAGASGDFKHAGLGQFDVATWKQATGQDIKPEDVGVVGRDPRLNGDQSVQAIAALAKQNRDRYVKDFGHEPNAGEIALMHQQGTGGGMSLLHALVNNPNETADTVVKADALTGNGVPAGVTVAQAVRHIEDYYTAKGKGGSFGGGGAEGQYTSQSDFLMTHVDEAVDNYRTEIAKDPAFAGRADLIDRAANNFENQYRRTIRDQNQQYIVDAHQLQSAIAQNHITNEMDLQAVSPDMAATWLRMQFENPEAVRNMRNWFASNAGGQTKTYGTQFNSMVNRVLAPVGDPNRINDPQQIDHMITPGENSILTNSGASMLHQMLAARNTPTGENDASTLRGFFNQAHTLISPLTKPGLGQTWPQGEQKYQHFVGQSLELIAAGRAEGKPMSELLKKGGDIDLLLGQSVPSTAQMRAANKEVVHDPRMKPALAAASYVQKSADPVYLQKGIEAKTISPYQAGQAVKMGARNANDLKTAYQKGWLGWDDVDAALKHLRTNGRNFWGQPVQ